MSTPADPVRTPYTIRPPREELEDFARRRLEHLRRADAAEAMRVEESMQRAMELLQEAEDDDDPA